MGNRIENLIAFMLAYESLENQIENYLDDNFDNLTDERINELEKLSINCVLAREPLRSEEYDIKHYKSIRNEWALNVLSSLQYKECKHENRNAFKSIISEKQFECLVRYFQQHKHYTESNEFTAYTSNAIYHMHKVYNSVKKYTTYTVYKINLIDLSSVEHDIKCLESNLNMIF